MQILILEDNAQKRSVLESHIAETHAGATVHSAATFVEDLREVTTTRYDLVILDLVVPRMDVNEEPADLTQDLIEVTRDFKSKNSRTPGIALTSYDDKAEENFRILNQQDIGVVTYAHGSNEWKAALDRKIASSRPTEHFDFVVVCALAEETEGFRHGGYQLSELEIKDGLECRAVQIESRKGLVVTAPRSGLVSGAITTTAAIEMFKPQLICMSGICAGVKGAAHIYDVIVVETCHQHDSGKWSANAFLPEIYSVAIDHQFAQQIKGVIGKDGFLQRITAGIIPKKDEYPDGMNSFSANVFLAPCASGSAVIADERMVGQIKSQQRKVAAIEMESYALYESARLAALKPLYVSAKTVVDDGVNKGDDFHRIGCILSARVVAEIVRHFKFI
jgi:nucleoside phosphorylase